VVEHYGIPGRGEGVPEKRRSYKRRTAANEAIRGPAGLHIELSTRYPQERFARSGEFGLDMEIRLRRRAKALFPTATKYPC